MTRSTRRVVVATRSSAKLREIRAIAGEEGGWEVVDLESAGIPASVQEEGIEVFDTFEENARAKAAYFSARAAELVMADDSGLCVDALDGEPGVRSRRFAPPEAGARDPDEANNLHLLRRLAGVPLERRTAHYLCVVSLMQGGDELGSWTGRCEGVILERPRGDGGFGYDPLFFLPELGMTFGELDAQAKNQISHRAAAVRAALRFLAQRH
jgi:XTP/dITP diphosphohydrolase